TVTQSSSGTTSAVFTVSLSMASMQSITVNYTTADGTAIAGGDYQAASGTLTFNPGETSKTITVLVNGDAAFDPAETFFVSLSNPPVNLPNTLQDPMISLFNSSGMIISNDNWADAANAQSIDPSLRPSNALESAILISLAPGAYTAIVSGLNGGTGIGLVEVFDLDATAPSKLSNISTRGLVETGDSVLIGGFIVKGAANE